MQPTRFPASTRYAVARVVALSAYTEAVGEHGALVDDEAGAAARVAVVPGLKQGGAVDGERQAVAGGGEA